MSNKTDKVKKSIKAKMVHEKVKRNVGRPAIPIDKEELIKLCGIHCTTDECCSFFGVSEDTLNNYCKNNFFSEDGTPLNFSEVFLRFQKAGNVSLRRLQWHSAEKGSVDMQKWLGKNNLLQSDNAAELAKNAEQEDRIKLIVEALWGIK